jgi:hypothetical protein
MITLSIHDDDDMAGVKYVSVSGESDVFDDVVKLFKGAALALGYTEGSVNMIDTESGLKEEVFMLEAQNRLLNEQVADLLRQAKANIKK